MSTINGKACVANGRNLIAQSDLKYGYINRDNGGIKVVSDNFYSDDYIPTNGETVFTLSSPDYAFKGSVNHTLAMYDSDKNYLGSQSITSATQTLSKPNAAYIRFSINFVTEGGTIFKLSDWLANHRYKLETGTLATPLTPAPVDKVFSNGKQVYGRNLLLDSAKEPSIVGNGAQNQGLGNKLLSFGKITNIPAKVGDPVTFSADILVTGTSPSGTFNFQFSNTPWGFISNSFNISDFTIGEKTHVTLYKTVPSNWLTSTNLASGVSVRMDNMPTTITLAISKWKFELGNTPTAWSPAPEDVM